jgi:guanylate kinase
MLTPARKRRGWRFSISYTTRERRKGERHGREYYFVDDAEFERMAARDEFAEHFKVHLYQYGTPRQPLEDVIQSGGVMLLDVDVQGAQRLKNEYPQAVTIFILPPSVEELQRRLKRRGTETDEHLLIRYENAKKEMSLWHHFEYTVINRSLKTAVRQVEAVIEAHPCRTENMDKEQINKLTR